MSQRNHHRRRVVVTGLGCVSPLGHSVASTWRAIVAGESGIARIASFDASAFATQIAGEVKDFAVDQVMAAKEARHMDRFMHLGVAAGIEAVQDSGLTTEHGDVERVGVMVGSGIGGLPLIEATHTEVASRGPRRISPYFIPATIINLISGHLSIRYGFKGPNLAIATACTTGLHCIGMAARLIEWGDADVMVAGGAESTISPLGIGGFVAARALSSRNDNPVAASRPWDRDRDGFVLGEGSGVMVLEDYEHAKRRGASIYAELVGFGMSADAFHMTAPPKDGSGASLCMSAAMRNAYVNPDQIGYINAHGTSTPLGDLSETQAIHQAFGAHAKSLVVNSTKSMTGHLLGGAGGLESVLTVMAIHTQTSPPTINLNNPDPQCDLDYCANEARNVSMAYAMKNSFGFGGSNGTLIFKAI